MQKSEPAEKLEDNLDKPESKDSSEATKSPAKGRSRLSTAFRSLRGSKTGRKKTDQSEVFSSGAEDLDSESTKKTSKKTKFTLTGIKKTKVHPKQTTTETQTTKTLERGKPSTDQYLTASPTSSKTKKKLKSKKSPLVVTVDPTDTPPKEQAPQKPERATGGSVRKTGSPHLLVRQNSVESELNLMKREGGTVERGRRFPRPSSVSIESEEKEIESPPKYFKPIEPSTSSVEINQSQLHSSSPPSGNNIKNPNLSGSIESTETVIEKKVRPHKISFVSPDLSFQEVSPTDSRNSSDSPKSESSVARRRIHYIQQATLYTEDERAAIEGKRDILSGISEYSLESDFDSMPAFGDLTMDTEEPPIMTSTTKEIREHLYKILVIGELGTGKTSFIKRYVHQFFSQNYRATIGVDFALKVLHWDQNTIVRLQLWDIAGQERFGNMTRVYYKEAVGAFIVFDVTRSGTFDCVAKWKQDLDSKVQLPDGNPIPCILLANKCDLENQGSAAIHEKMDEYVKENNFAGWFETSAKENINIDEAAKALVNKILLNDKLISAADIADSEKINLNTANGQTTAQMLKSKCSC